jgi:hypothetical protein
MRMTARRASRRAVVGRGAECIDTGLHSERLGRALALRRFAGITYMYCTDCDDWEKA